MTTVTTKAPGKLYLAGEYAVVTPGNLALLTAVDRFIYCNISDEEVSQDFPTLQINALNHGSFFSQGFTDRPIPWMRLEENNEFTFIHQKKPLRVVQRTIQVAEAYVFEQGKSGKSYNITVESQLDEQSSGQKYGLGSSAAVSVAICRAVLELYGISVDHRVIYKLVALAHLSLNSKGSFGDIASSTYGGYIEYACFDREWIASLAQTKNISDLVKMDWPKLKLTPIRPSKDLQLFVGWTGQPASTDQLIEIASHNKKENNFNYDDFLTHSNHHVHALTKAVQEGDLDQIKTHLRTLQDALIEMTNLRQIPYLTKDLNKFIQLCQILELPGKISGAGGGDCAFVLYNQTLKDNINQLKNILEEDDIKILNLNVLNVDEGGY